MSLLQKVCNPFESGAASYQFYDFSMVQSRKMHEI
jgi:hypothetical protein